MKHRLTAPCKRPDQDQTLNLGMYPDWKSNMQPFAAWTMLQPSNTPGPFFFAFCLLIHFAGSSFFNEWQHLNFQVQNSSLTDNYNSLLQLMVQTSIKSNNLRFFFPLHLSGLLFHSPHLFPHPSSHLPFCKIGEGSGSRNQRQMGKILVPLLLNTKRLSFSPFQQSLVAGSFIGCVRACVCVCVCFEQLTISYPQYFTNSLFGGEML